VAVDVVFFWLTGVRGDCWRRAANDGGGDVQRTTEEATCSERRQGRRGAIIIILWLAALWEEGAKTKIWVIRPWILTIPVYEITKAATKRAKSLLTTCECCISYCFFFFYPHFTRAPPPKQKTNKKIRVNLPAGKKKTVVCPHTSTFSFSVSPCTYYLNYFYYAPTIKPLSRFLGIP
jgi:hypothetical protein